MNSHLHNEITNSLFCRKTCNFHPSGIPTSFLKQLYVVLHSWQPYLVAGFGRLMQVDPLFGVCITKTGIGSPYQHFSDDWLRTFQPYFGAHFSAQAILKLSTFPWVEIFIAFWSYFTTWNTVDVHPANVHPVCPKRPLSKWLNFGNRFQPYATSSTLSNILASVSLVELATRIQESADTLQFLLWNILRGQTKSASKDSQFYTSIVHQSRSHSALILSKSAPGNY